MSWITESDYNLAWAIYLAAAFGCLMVGFRITSWMWRWLREIIRVIGAVALFTPTLVDPERMLFAPAIAIAALDLLFKTGDNAWRAVSDLTLYGMIAFALYFVMAVLRWVITRFVIKRKPREDARTLAERIDEDEADEHAAMNSSLRADARL